MPDSLETYRGFLNFLRGMETIGEVLERLLPLPS